MKRKIFIITPRGGLCNQLITIANGIIYGHYFKRDIYFDGFQIDYRNNDKIIEISKVLNLIKLQETINMLNLSTNILLSIDNNKYEKIENDYLSIKDLYNVIIDINFNNDILNIGNLINVDLPPSNEYMNLYIIRDIINNSFYFSEKYYLNAGLIKKKLNISKYACIHLRIEDDAIEYYSKHHNINKDHFNRLLKIKYIKELDYISKHYKEIYVCSSLIIYNNENNSFYKDIKKKYSLVDKNDFININDVDNYRELYAIIDFIISKDADFFIGSKNSSFSYYINNYFEKNNKKSILL
jgi:hypothetical protein